MSSAIHEAPPREAESAPSGELFPPEVRKQLHADDWSAAAMVAGLMVAIFTAGVIMYIIIAVSAFGGPP